ncbi:uncharacterized protein FTOL_06364 [Fusarium torulosum]|uniref:NB-ARC domain-containing protein n=1 Tax=Fusarium torulosum TaxID=33205 RepID=A0AAE8M9R2_9HYPO|nr:uncharacterized protein FTOL_06364 [Fusarium torulosum]
MAQREGFFLLHLPATSKMEVRLSLGNAFVASIVLVCTIPFLSSRLRSGKGDDNFQKRPAKDLRGRSPFDILYDPKANTKNAAEANVDIIAVHGLGSNVDRTWTWRSTDDPQKTVNWLKDADMLQSKIPTARILAFNYDSTWLSDAPRTRVELCGEELVQSLHRLRQESDRPIVFIAHSFGGLVVQDALLYAHREKQYRHILQQTKGFISLGTPFRGTKVQWATDLVARLMRFAGSHHHILSLLVYDNHQLRDKVHSLGRLRKTFSFPIFCFFELNQTQFIKIPLFPNASKGMVVEESSACLSGDERSHLQTDHINLNKYSSPDDRSFLSVSAEIVRMCNNASRVANAADPKNTTPIQKGHWVVPFDRNEGFVGRDDILPDLLVRVSPDHQKYSCQRTVVEGLGGIGKSQIALEAAFRLRNLDPTCSIFWVAALSAISFENAYRDIATDLGIQCTEDESSKIVSLVKQALSNQAVGKWLLIIDNADDPSLMFEPGSLASYLPSSPQGSILFTTRTSEITSLLDIPSVGIFRIDAMSPQESMDLMGTRLSISQMEDVEGLHALVELLCHLPLALKQAASYMQLHRLTPKDYIHRCQSSDKGLIRLLSRDFGDRTRYGDAQHPVAKTWLISFVHLSSNNPLASQYLQFMSFLSEKNIPLSILPPEDELEVQEAIGTLQAYGFVTAREDREFVDMHRLVRLAIRSWLEDKGEDKESYKHVQARMLVLFDTADYGNQAEWARYIPHCHTVVDKDALSTSAQATWHLLMVFSEALVSGRMWKAALNLSQRAKNLSIDIYDPNDVHQIISMSNYAVLLIIVGHRNDAEKILRETLLRQEWLFGKHHYKTREMKRWLGLLLLMRGQYKELEQMNRNLLQEAEKVFGKGHEQTIIAACDLCNPLLALRRYKEAEKIARQSLVQSRSILEGQTLTRFRIMSKLADSLMGLQQFQEAEEITRQAIKIAEMKLGKEHPNTLSITRSLASILYQSGQFLLAEELSRKLVKAQERLFGKENPETLQSADTLAATLCGLDRFLGAEEIYRDNLQAYQRLYGEEYDKTISTAIGKKNNIPNDGQSFLIGGAEVYHS